MAGPVFARLAREPTDDDLRDFRAFGQTRQVTQELARGRRVSAWLGPQLMIGAEASSVDWGGWAQFMPATAHWRSPVGAATLWLVDAHEVHATATDHRLAIVVPGGASELRFCLYCTDDPVVSGTVVSAAGMDVDFASGIARVSVAKVGDELHEVRAVSARDAGGIAAELRFTEPSE
jgi:hypothetical protein